jgi:acyl-CoA thioesterase FadM
MIVLLRGVLTALLSRLKPRITPLDESTVRLRVWPNDLDFNVHLNNGRYLSLMDLGRLDLLERTGLFRVALKRGWAPMIGAATIRFRRSLAPFERFTLRSRLISWDEKWLYIEQRFERTNGELAAIGFVRGLMRGKEGNVPTAQLFDIIGFTGPSPAMPDGVRQWIEAEL